MPLSNDKKNPDEPLQGYHTITHGKVSAIRFYARKNWIVQWFIQYGISTLMYHVISVSNEHFRDHLLIYREQYYQNITFTEWEKCIN